MGVEKQENDALVSFEKILVERAGDGPGGPNYDPELLVAGMALLDEVTCWRAALVRYASRGEWAQGDAGTCYLGRQVAAKAIGAE